MNKQNLKDGLHDAILISFQELERGFCYVIDQLDASSAEIKAGDSVVVLDILEGTQSKSRGTVFSNDKKRLAGQVKIVKYVDGDGDVIITEGEYNLFFDSSWVAKVIPRPVPEPIPEPAYKPDDWVEVLMIEVGTCISGVTFISDMVKYIGKKFQLKELKHGFTNFWKFKDSDGMWHESWFRHCDSPKRTVEVGQWWRPLGYIPHNPAQIERFNGKHWIFSDGTWFTNEEVLRGKQFRVEEIK